MSEHSAGRELDALIAERVMGRAGRFVPHVYINGHFVECETWLPIGATPKHPPVGTFAGQMPRPYSADIAAAWEVVAKINLPFSVWNGWEFDDTREIVGDSMPIRPAWYAYFRDAGKAVEAETAPLAICRAALKAVESVVHSREHGEIP